MAFDRIAVKECLDSRDFRKLFIEELGWNKDRGQDITLDKIGLDGVTLEFIAEKYGFKIYRCLTYKDDGNILDYSTRLEIEKNLSLFVYQHLVIFETEDGDHQYWQWVRQEPGKARALRGQTYQKGSTGERLIQKLRYLYVSLEDEEELTIVDLSGRVKKAFDKEEAVTKKFFDDFKKKHDNFLKFIENIPDDEFVRWYASVIINRLMFIYFLQKKGFLDGDDRDYLRTKFNQIKENGGGYYKNFLCHLFFEGFAKDKTNRLHDMNALLGDIPYLNGGLFLKHEIERDYDKINISDSAFEELFDFFDRYDWHLDERPLKRDNEINPDVLGYIFEKYINQKQMGAYYTKEDITGYMSGNTIIPWLFDRAKEACPEAFYKGEHLWELLPKDPDRYIYEAMKHGADKELPDYIKDGINNVKKRTRWNEPSDDSIDTDEIWRETVARHQRYHDIKAKLENGDIHTIEDFITYNLDIKQFARDAIQYAEEVEVVNAFWEALENIKILDPACGSGAFLFAALNILEELYEACLDRMQAFVEEEKDSDTSQDKDYIKLFRKRLVDIDKHPNRPYFIYKTIIIKNIYGVDIIEEGTEICKLRLFLKLAAQLEISDEIEPLPDIDFNIKSGNSLVGYTSLDDLDEKQDDILEKEKKEGIKKSAKETKRQYEEYINVQDGSKEPRTIMLKKENLERNLKHTGEELSKYLSKHYKNINGKDGYEQWNKKHKPFHWCLEFYEIIENGGFDVIIGNPPYLEKSQINYEIRNLSTEVTKAIHAMFIENDLKKLHPKGKISLIVPLSIVSTKRMKVVQDILEADRSTWYAHYSWRPAKLFDKVNRAVTIFISSKATEPKSYSTNYQKWYSSNREGLLEKIVFSEIPRDRDFHWAPKFSSPVEKSIFDKITKTKILDEFYIYRSNHDIFYRTSGGLYWKVFTNFSPEFIVNGEKSTSSKEAIFNVSDEKFIYPIIAILSSNLFWWWYTISSNLRDLTPNEIKNFPLSKTAAKDKKLATLGEKYIADIVNNSSIKIREHRNAGKAEIQTFKIQKSKHIIDEIDIVLADHYGFTDEELDFIINYDIKFRMNLLNETEDDDDE